MSSFALRSLALLCMLCDHAGLALFPGVTAFRVVGRFAFPLYCFLITEGCLHTRSLRAYARRLLLTAIVSELPFDLLIFGRVGAYAEQNVLFALLLGLLACCCVDYYEEKPALQAAGALVLMMTAMLLRVSFGWLGVGLCLAFRLFAGNRPAQAVSLTALEALYGASLFFSGVSPAWACVAFAACLAAVPVLFYNGKRGPRFPALTFLFYAAYPLHLAALCLIRALRLVPPGLLG